MSAATVVNTTNDSQSNAQILSDLYDAFAAGNVEAALPCVSADFVLHLPGTGHNAGEYWGPAGLRKFMDNIADYNGGVFDLEVPVFAVTGEHGFSREVLRINRTHDPQRVWTLRISNQFRVRTGKLSEVWIIPEDQRLYDEYWTSPAGVPERNPAAQRPVAARRQLLDLAHATSYENAQLLSRMYDQFWNGDMDALRGLIANDVIVNIVGRSAMSGVYQGWEGYMTFRHKLMAMAGSKYKLERHGSRRQCRRCVYC
jgi:ketosteroid isomerase-like protein